MQHQNIKNAHLISLAAVALIACVTLTAPFTGNGGEKPEPTQTHAPPTEIPPTEISAGATSINP
ncbi:MAG: hypothetical protein AB1564_08195, partial [Chloroflexota bacterium]